MRGTKELLRQMIENDGGSREFSRSADGVMLAYLAGMARAGELVVLGETEGGVIYALPDRPPGAERLPEATD